MPESPNPGRILIGGLALVLVAAAGVALGYVTRSHESAGLEIEAPAQRQAVVRGVVQAVTSDSVTVQTEGGPVTLKVGDSTPREAIESLSLSRIQPGDWVNAGGVPHAQTIYALTALVVIPASNLEAGR